MVCLPECTGPETAAAGRAEDRVSFGLRGAVRDTTLARTPA
ncbi:hypothetical protein OG780_03950 [Streptomyces sp. NBC_00386]